MADEHRERANAVLARACQRLTRQQWYNQKHTCVGHFMAEQGKRVRKADIVAAMPEMTKDDYMTVSKLSMSFYVAAKLQLHYLFFKCVLIFQVIPQWCDGKEAAFEALVMRWLGEDADFNAVSERNKANRGTEGTHSAGSRSTDRYRLHMVHIYMEEPAFISPHVPT